MAVGALVALGAVAGGRSVSALDPIKTLVGNYKLKSATNATLHGANVHTLAEEALAHGNEAAHIIAELRTFTEITDNWDDIDADYDSDIKKWTELNPLLGLSPAYASNE